MASVAASAAISPAEWQHVTTGTVVTINENSYTAQHAAGANHALVQHATKDIQRFEVREGDFFSVDGEGGNRSELSGGLFKFAPSDTIYFSLRLAIEPGEDFDPLFCVLFQLHQEDGVGDSPSLAFEFDNGIGRLLTRDDDGTITEHWAERITRGDFHQLAGELRLDPAGATSLLKFWYDGTEVVNRTGFKFGYAKSRHYYWKYGIYREAGPTTFAVRFANVAVTSLPPAAEVQGTE